MTAVMLPPRELAVQQSVIHGRHRFGVIVIGYAQVFCADQLIHHSRRYRRHIAALVIEPFRIPLLRHPSRPTGTAPT
jgi:hypothetical protein